MKVIAYTALQYGRDYLAPAICALIDEVSEWHILYSPNGSHGRRSQIPCPDTEDELHEIAWQAAGLKLHWHKGEWLHENEQRNSIYKYAPDADAIVIVDSDEIYEDGLLRDALNYGSKLTVYCHQLRLPFTHMWRSFKRGFAHDPAYPTRIVFPNQWGETVTLPTKQRIWHYGYAQRSEIVRFKMLQHGHFNEFRHDVNWFQDVFMANRQYDCHPIGSEFWNCEDIDLSRLPSVLETHPYRHLELIP